MSEVSKFEALYQIFSKNSFGLWLCEDFWHVYDICKYRIGLFLVRSKSLANPCTKNKNSLKKKRLIVCEVFDL